jgi:hypothetical protein
MFSSFQLKCVCDKAQSLTVTECFALSGGKFAWCFLFGSGYPKKIEACGKNQQKTWGLPLLS